MVVNYNNIYMLSIKFKVCITHLRIFETYSCSWVNRATIYRETGELPTLAISVFSGGGVTTLTSSGGVLTYSTWVQSGGGFMNSMRPPSTQMLGVSGYNGPPLGSASVSALFTKSLSYATKCSFSSHTGWICLQQ